MVKITGVDDKGIGKAEKQAVLQPNGHGSPNVLVEDQLCGTGVSGMTKGNCGHICLGKTGLNKVKPLFCTVASVKL